MELDRVGNVEITTTTMTRQGQRLHVLLLRTYRVITETAKIFSTVLGSTLTSQSMRDEIHVEISRQGLQFDAVSLKTLD